MNTEATKTTTPAAAQPLTRQQVKATDEKRTALLKEITKNSGVLAMYLPEGVKVSTYMRQIRDAVVANPALLDCSTNSVLREIARGCASGLPIDGRFSSLIVRTLKGGKKVAVWDASARGMTMQALASGLIKTVQSGVVREGDVYRVRHGTAQEIVHEPAMVLDPAQEGPIIGAYAFAIMASGEKVIEPLTRADLERIRAKASAEGMSAPWNAWPDQMSRKSARRRLLIGLPAAPVRLPAIGDPLGAGAAREEIDADTGEIYTAPPAHLSSEDIAAGIDRLPPHEYTDAGADVADFDDDIPF